MPGHFLIMQLTRPLYMKLSLLNHSRDKSFHAGLVCPQRQAEDADQQPQHDDLRADEDLQDVQDRRLQVSTILVTILFTFERYIDTLEVKIQ